MYLICSKTSLYYSSDSEPQRSKLNSVRVQAHTANVNLFIYFFDSKCIRYILNRGTLYLLYIYMHLCVFAI